MHGLYGVQRSEKRGIVGNPNAPGRARAMRFLLSLILVLNPVGAWAEETPPASSGVKAAPTGEDNVAPASDEKPAPVGNDNVTPVSDEKPAPASEGKTEPPKDEKAAAKSPWAFGFELYLWLPGVHSDLSSGTHDASINESIIDIFNDTKGIPLCISGRLESHWKRLGLYVDGTYIYLNFKDKEIKGVNTGLLTQLGLLEYSAMFRVIGVAAGDLPEWAEKSGPPRVDLYAGGRSIWLKNVIDRDGSPKDSNESTLTSPLVGGRAVFDISPRFYFVLLSGAGLATFGYRTTLFRVPIALSLGYRVLYLDVDTNKGDHTLKSETTLHGPVIGFTLCW